MDQRVDFVAGKAALFLHAGTVAKQIVFIVQLIAFGLNRSGKLFDFLVEFGIDLVQSGGEFFSFIAMEPEPEDAVGHGSDDVIGKDHLTGKGAFGNLSIENRRLGEFDDLGGFFVDEFFNLESIHNVLRAFFADDAEIGQREFDVVVNGHVGIKRVVLENESDAAFFRREVGDVLFAKEDFAFRLLF